MNNNEKIPVNRKNESEIILEWSIKTMIADYLETRQRYAIPIKTAYGNLSALLTVCDNITESGIIANLSKGRFNAVIVIGHGLQLVKRSRFGNEIVSGDGKVFFEFKGET